MADQTLPITRFDGGLSDDDTYGPGNSFSEGQSIDFRSSPAYITLGRKLTKESGAIVTTEIFDAVRVPAGSGTVYLAGDTKIYKRTPGANGAAGTYTVDSTAVVHCRDLDYRPDVDAVFLYDSTFISEIATISGTPTYNYAKYTTWYPYDSGQSGGTYVPATSITESSDYFTFTATNDPMTGVVLFINKGTGTWTITLHDAANNVIATSTRTSLSLPGASVNVYFVFSAVARLKIGATYHVHVTKTVADGDIRTSSANTIATAFFQVVANRLIDTGAFGHRTMQYGAKTYICNERYLGEWEILNTNPQRDADVNTGLVGALAATGFLPHRLVFPAEVMTIGIAQYGEYIAIAGQIQNSTDTQNVQSTTGIIFFWNGTDVFYNFALPIPQGAPNSLFSVNNIIYWEANGSWYRWSGGDIQLVFQFPGVDEFLAVSGAPSSETYIRAGRQVMAVNGNMMQIGFPYATVNANAKIGLFSYGQSKGFMPMAIGYDAILSTGNDTVQFDTSTNPDTPITGITMVKNFGTNFLVAWKDRVGGATVYGVDYMNDTSSIATSGAWASMWFNNGTPGKEKTPKALKFTFKEALPAGCTFTPRIKYDEGSYITGDTVSAGAIESVFTLGDQVSHQRFYEVMFGFTMTSSSGNKPRVRSASFKFDDNEEELIGIESFRPL